MMNMASFRTAHERATTRERDMRLGSNLNPDVTSGWTDHSGSGDYASFRVFAVGTILRAAQFNAWALEHSVRFKALVGAWNGKMERSFIVPETEVPRLDNWFADEEATLLLGPRWRAVGTDLPGMHGSRDATLIYRNGDRLDAGLWVDVPRADALRFENWTYDPLRDKYSVCVPRDSEAARAHVAGYPNPLRA